MLQTTIRLDRSREIPFRFGNFDAIQRSAREVSCLGENCTTHLYSPFRVYCLGNYYHKDGGLYDVGQNWPERELLRAKVRRCIGWLT